MGTILLSLLLVAAVVGLGILSGSETALFSLSPLQIKTFRTDPDKRKRIVAKLVSQPRELLITLIILIIVMSILVQNTISSLVGEGAGWGLSVGVPLALNLILGEVIPKSLALPNNTKISCRVAPFLLFLQKALFPLRKILAEATNFIIKICFFFLKKEDEISIDELQHALKASKEHGVLHQDEAELIRGYLLLEESSVKDLMRPREDVIHFDLNEPLDRLIHLFVDQECTRIPVCLGSLDSIQGIISSRLFFLYKQKLKKLKISFPYLKKPFTFLR